MAGLAQKPAERTDLEHTDLLRWEDDGGQAIEHKHPANHSTVPVALGNYEPLTLPAIAELEGLQRR